ncbi:ribonuclease III [Pelotalea chapellei]|uniref:Ribonuclease 3 n=1 Tax=Pelotalea chapellei TaxID=44671 RepID=A0ABS5U7R1_9BACT|nr:ribonuclease III [Pelotalea chapellei]MBT1071689.1 ribonuclease III [Pelotalea chapellei]
METDLQYLEQCLDYKFVSSHLAVNALIHPSYGNEKGGAGADYQRLEFLGDAVLGMLLAESLFNRFAQSDEGTLSRYRSQMADQSTLAAVARNFGLGQFILLGRGEEQTAGREKDSILADVLEALIAAVYLDGGLENARRVIVRLYGEILEKPESLFAINDAKSELQELLSMRRLSPPYYHLVEESGPPHQRHFHFQVLVGDRVAGEGEGRSKKSAQQAAAVMALKHLREAGS